MGSVQSQNEIHGKKQVHTGGPVVGEKGGGERSKWGAMIKKVKVCQKKKRKTPLNRGSTGEL